MKSRWIVRAGLIALMCVPVSARAQDDAAAAARKAAILTPPAPMTPRINGPRIYGERTGKPFFYHIPTTGQRPIAFKADGLPAGLTLDAASGTITGRSSAAGSHPVKITASNSLGTDSITLNIVIGDTIALTPPLGWNSWNRFAGRVTAEDVKGAADAMVNAGLIDHGWTYINIDDTWEGQRDANGVLATNQKFPDMKGLADYIHGKG
ncbi:MAG TPA: putative Ig domain-containing protein, partial [Humisphaera sp.]|nr:putative Ig domain-containing protein [Humisphaera sp.]